MVNLNIPLYYSIDSNKKRSLLGILMEFDLIVPLGGLFQTIFDQFSVVSGTHIWQFFGSLDVILSCSESNRNNEQHSASPSRLLLFTSAVWHHGMLNNCCMILMISVSCFVILTAIDIDCDLSTTSERYCIKAFTLL